MHGDGGRVVEGAEHLHGEWVPVDLGILLRHPDVLTHTLVASMEPEEEKMRKFRAVGDEKDGTTAVGTRHLFMALKNFCRYAMSMWVLQSSSMVWG